MLILMLIPTYSQQLVGSFNSMWDNDNNTTVVHKLAYNHSVNPFVFGVYGGTYNFNDNVTYVKYRFIGAKVGYSNDTTLNAMLNVHKVVNDDIPLIYNFESS